jgi:hypothetical protein
VELGAWLTQNTFNLLTGVVAVAGLCFTAVSLRSETKTRRIANLLTITANHREVWNIFLQNKDKDLARLRQSSVNLTNAPVTDAERLFVNMVIQHLNSVYQTLNDHLVVKIEGLRRDVAQFFSLPVPREVWEKVKVVQNDDFVAFIENCLSSR